MNENKVIKILLFSLFFKTLAKNVYLLFILQVKQILEELLSGRFDYLEKH